MKTWLRMLSLTLVFCQVGCRSSAPPASSLAEKPVQIQYTQVSHVVEKASQSDLIPVPDPVSRVSTRSRTAQASPPVKLTGFAQDTQPGETLSTPDDSVATSIVLQLPDDVPVNANGDFSPLTLEEVIHSVVQTYPLLRAVQEERMIAQGDATAAAGKFDTKFKAGTIEAPLGFYENYQHFLGIEQPLYSGANVFAGYRLGRGVFEPWYQERITDHAGEFKVGMQIPLLQNRRIDERRLKVIKANISRTAAEPIIRAEFLQFLRGGANSYWNWVAAGAKYQIAKDMLKNADDRTRGLQTRLKEGDISEIELTDNKRLIASRQVKVSKAFQKLQESAVKLSLFVRNPDGSPRVPTEAELPPDFPGQFVLDEASRQEAFMTAWANRPELQSLGLKRESLEVELSQAANLARPSLNLELIGAQDVGEPASKKRDKHELELDAALQFAVPLQRREARGKQRAVEAKLRQLSAKEQFTREKIAAEVQAAQIALQATAEQIARNKESLDLARQMEEAERKKFDLGESNLLLVNLREKYTADAAAELVDSQLTHQLAIATWRAVLAQSPSITTEEFSAP